MAQTMYAHVNKRIKKKKKTCLKPLPETHCRMFSVSLSLAQSLLKSFAPRLAAFL
jgi:hypothetical protein